MQPNTDQWGQPIQPAPQPAPEPMLIGSPQPAGVGGGMVLQGGRPTQMMGFIDSVKSVLMNNFANFEGRASRSEFWWFALFIFIAGIPLGMIDGMLFGWEIGDPMWISNIFTLTAFLPNLALSVRRTHDHNHSGWWLLVPFAILYFALAEGEAVPNAYGPVPTNVLAQ